MFNFWCLYRSWPWLETHKRNFDRSKFNVTRDISLTIFCCAQVNLFDVLLYNKFTANQRTEFEHYKPPVFFRLHHSHIIVIAVHNSSIISLLFFILRGSEQTIHLSLSLSVNDAFVSVPLIVDLIIGCPYSLVLHFLALLLQSGTDRSTPAYSFYPSICDVPAFSSAAFSVARQLLNSVSRDVCM